MRKATSSSTNGTVGSYEVELFGPKDHVRPRIVIPLLQVMILGDMEKTIYVPN